jgi:hypothetical protein
MFSCYRATRRTLDRLERPLVLFERLKLFGHFLICRHCCMHDRQIRGLAHLFQSKQKAAELPAASNGANFNDSSLSNAARARISAVLSNRFPAP